MSPLLFSTLMAKVLPLYLISATGYIATRFLAIQREQIARLLIYFITPCVIFIGTLKAGLNTSLLILPFVFLLVGCTLSILHHYLAPYVFKDGSDRLLSFAMGTGNTGYLGIPACLCMFGPDALPVAVLCALGTVLFENTLGVYLIARHRHSHKESLLKLLTLPGLYAYILGITCNLIHLPIPDLVLTTLELFKGAYAPLGMMLVGMGLATVCYLHLDKKFIFWMVGMKFLGWVILIKAILLLDQHFWQQWSPQIQSIMLMQAAAPLAANTVAFASEFQCHPEKAALAVFISTLLALILLPLATLL